MKDKKWRSLSNKWITVDPGVELTEHIDEVIADMDPYFEKAGLKARVSSGKRDAASQMRIIRTALVNNRLAADYQEAFDDMNSKIMYEGKEVYCWQPGWSKLLNIGYIVNPPYPAEVLMDYYRPGSTVNSRGRIIQPSPHFFGTSFDIRGGKNGVNDEVKVVAGCMDKVNGLKGYLVERANNCVHCDCHKVVQHLNSKL